MLRSRKNTIKIYLFREIAIKPGVKMSLSESESQSSWDEAHPKRPIYIIFQNIPQLLWSKTVSCVATQKQGNPVFTGEEKKVKNANKFGKEQHPICF